MDVSSAFPSSTTVPSVAANKKLNLTQLCRICASSNEYLIPIFEGEGVQLELSIKVDKYLPVKITSTDALPTSMCYQCASSILSWHDLVVNCVEADKHLRSVKVNSSSEFWEEDKFHMSTTSNSEIITTKEANSTHSKESLMAPQTPHVSSASSEDFTKLSESSADKKLNKNERNIFTELSSSHEPSSKETCSEKSQAALFSDFHLSQVTKKKFSQYQGRQFSENKLSSVNILNFSKPDPSSHLCFDPTPQFSDFNRSVNISGNNFNAFAGKNVDFSSTNESENDNHQFKFFCDFCNSKFIYDFDLKCHINVCHSQSSNSCSVTTFPSDKFNSNTQTLNDNGKFFNDDVMSQSLNKNNSVNSVDHIPSESNDFLGPDFLISPVNSQTIPSNSTELHHSITNEIQGEVAHFMKPNLSSNLMNDLDLASSEDNVDMKNGKEKNIVKKTRCKKKKSVFICSYCGKKFNLKDSLVRHTRIHTNERPYSCSRCDKSFRDSGGLSRHVKDVHDKLKKYRCDLCSSSFANKLTLIDHSRIHTNERPYDCSTCGKLFKTKAALYLHNKIHLNNFPFTCTLCHKSFKRRYEFNEHKSVHTGEKSFICDQCGRRFRLRNELLRHLSIHSSEKPFSCTICSMSFRQNRYLKSHMASKHLLEKKSNENVVSRAVQPESSKISFTSIPVAMSSNNNAPMLLEPDDASSLQPYLMNQSPSFCFTDLSFYNLK